VGGTSWRGGEKLFREEGNAGGILVHRSCRLLETVEGQTMGGEKRTGREIAGSGKESADFS